MRYYIKNIFIAVSILSTFYSLILGDGFDADGGYFLFMVLFLYKVIIPFLEKKDIHFTAIYPNSGKLEDTIFRALLFIVCFVFYLYCVHVLLVSQEW